MDNGYANGAAVVASRGSRAALSSDDYRRKHDLIVQGQAVPEPLQSFDAAGFTSGIMDEVHHLVQAGSIVCHLPSHFNAYHWLHEGCTASVSQAAPTLPLTGLLVS